MLKIFLLFLVLTLALSSEWRMIISKPDETANHKPETSMNEYKKTHRGFEIIVFPDYKMKSGEVSHRVQSWSSVSTFDDKKEISKGWSTRKQAFAGEIKYIEKRSGL